MLAKTYNPFTLNITFRRIAILMLAFFLFAVVNVRSQSKDLPPWQSYRDIKIGMTVDQVQEKLGKPKSFDDHSLFYVFSDTENAQFLYDAAGKIRTISAVFEGAAAAAPTFNDVFGATAEAAVPSSDGSMFKMVRYQEARFWISYNRMGGDTPMTIVIVQKF